MSVELSVKQKETLASAIAWGAHPKNSHPETTIELAKQIRSGWFSDENLLDHVKRGFDLALRSYA